jgi:hypothetical protein
MTEIWPSLRNQAHGSLAHCAPGLPGCVQPGPVSFAYSVWASWAAPSVRSAPAVHLRTDGCAGILGEQNQPRCPSLTLAPPFPFPFLFSSTASRVSRLPLSETTRPISNLVQRGKMDRRCLLEPLPSGRSHRWVDTPLLSSLTAMSLREHVHRPL